MCIRDRRREVLGKKYQPCGVIVSLDGTDIPFDHYIFDVDPKEEYKPVSYTHLDVYKRQATRCLRRDLTRDRL